MSIHGVGGSSPFEMPKENNSGVDQVLLQIQKLQEAFENPSYKTNPSGDFQNFSKNFQMLKEQIANSGITLTSTENRLVTGSLNVIQGVINGGENELLGLQSDFYNGKPDRVVNSLLDSFSNLTAVFSDVGNPNVSPVYFQIRLLKMDLESGDYKNNPQQDYANFNADYQQLLSTLSQEKLSPSQQELVSEFKDQMNPIIQGGQNYLLAIQSKGDFTQFDTMFSEMESEFYNS